MAEQTIDKLQIELEASAEASVKNIGKLADSLEKLKSVTASGEQGLSRFAASMDKLKSAAEGLKGKSSTLTSMSKSLKALSEVKFSATDELKNFAESFESFGGSVDAMREFRSGVGSLKTAFNNLDKINFDGMSDRIKRLVDAIKPLTDEMIRGGQGVSNFGTQMKDLVSAAKATNSVKTASDSRGVAYNSHQAINTQWLLKKGKMVFDIMKQVGSTIGGFVSEINDYIEDLNLFTVAMGDYAEQGMAYANKMQSVLGVNAGEAMRYMGVFQQMATSMGFTQERAYTLSQTLTQLGYDWSSYYNIGTEESFTKLQAAISGEIEPVRRLGIDISSTRLQQELYNLGIKKFVEQLSQADKATLRYIALLKQSQNAMGDLSRSIDSPSNALRMLNAQWEVAKREIGSVFIPMLIKILPPAIAVVRILGDIARSVANMFGFELPKIDYSGVGNLSTGLSDAAGNADDLTDNLKETKKEISGLLGFDEINALSETQSSSSNASSSLNTSSVLGGIELPTYDMFSEVENSIDKWVEKFKSGFEKIKSFIEPFTPLLKGLGILIGSTLAFNWVKGALTKAKKLSWFTDFLDFARKGLKWYSAEFKKTNNIWTAAGNGIKNLQGKISKLPTATKVVAGLATVAAEVVIVKNLFYKAKEGGDSLWGAIAASIPIVGLASTALYMLAGPAGAAIGVLAGVAAAVWGVVEADLEMHRQLEATTFYADNGGQKISDLAAKYTAWSDEIVKANQQIINNHAEIENSQEKIREFTADIQNLTKQYEIGAINSEEFLPRITQSIQNLHDQTLENLNKISSNIKYALAGSVGESLEELGVSIPQVISALDAADKKITAAFDDATNKAMQLTEELSHLKAGTDEYNAVNERLQEEFQKMSAIAGAAADNEINKLSQGLVALANGLDFESPEAFNSAMEEIKTSTQAAKDSVDKTYNSLIDEFSIKSAQLRAIGDESGAQFFDGIVSQLDIAKNNKKNEIDEITKQTGELIQNQFSQNMAKTVQENGPSMWDSIKASLFTSAGAPTTAEEMQAERVGADMAKPITEAFESTFGTNMDSAIKNVTDGLIEGLTTEDILTRLQASATTLATTISGWFKKEQQIESPSKVMAELGRYSAEGLIVGLGEQEPTLQQKMSQLAFSITNGLVGTPSAMQTNGQNITNGFLSGLSGLNRDTDSKLSNLSSKFSNWSATLKTPHLSWDMNGLQTSGILKTILETLNLPTTLPKLNVSWYAQGGIFNSPRIIGVGERGPEAVVPLSENAEWIEALSVKIAQRGAQIANTSIPERYDNSGGDWTFILQRADGTTEGEVTITAADRMNQSHGEMKIPMYV